MLENVYDADPWCGLYRYQSMWAITSINADADTDARCGYTLRHWLLGEESREEEGLSVCRGWGRG